MRGVRSQLRAVVADDGFATSKLLDDDVLLARDPCARQRGDVTAICGLIGLCAIGVVAIKPGDGETVAAPAVGSIGGWMARGSGERTTTTTEGDPTVKTTTEG